MTKDRRLTSQNTGQLQKLLISTQCILDAVLTAQYTLRIDCHNCSCFEIETNIQLISYDEIGLSFWKL